MEKIFFILIVGFIILVPTILFIVYCLFARHQKYNINQVFSICEKSNKACLPDVSKYLLSSAIHRTNGWNTMIVIFSSIYYSFNFWSIAFAVLGVGFDGILTTTSIKVCSIISIFTLVANLFLQSEHKWKMFHYMWTDSAEVTNNFINSIDDNTNIKKSIVDYSNAILQIEKSQNQNS